MQVLEFMSTIADLDVYRRSKIGKDGTRHYSYLVIYIDDVLSIDEELETFINMISNVYRIKLQSIKMPDT